MKNRHKLMISLKLSERTEAEDVATLKASVGVGEGEVSERKIHYI